MHCISWTGINKVIQWLNQTNLAVSVTSVCRSEKAPSETLENQEINHQIYRITILTDANNVQYKVCTAKTKLNSAK